MALAARAVLGAVAVLVAALTFAAAASAQEPVTVDFTYSPVAPKAGEPVTLTSASSSQSAIVRESWDFNSDGKVDATGRTATAIFIAPATYSVKLEVENVNGDVRSVSKLVTVVASTPPPPQPPPAPPPAPPAPPAPLPRPATPSSVAPVSIAPFPIVRLTGSYSSAGLKLRLFSVTAPAGVTIRVRCAGRGCPYRQRGPFVVGTSGTRPVGSARYVRIGDFRGRLLKPGLRLQVYVAHPQRVGKYTRFTIRRGPPQRVDRCLRPSGKIFSCG